ncbi:MAG: aminoglycoside phosphotransferase family protein [Antarcticimicrobium sp.]|uniref:aminoglycoside phosphotransferase family protein n=1 Tax=Antarcticimicrobium sp. TaxID=2824147 RepID=UPI00261D1524|nr:aminoglycoside phosphotransferase family protein [Antarcticimicrobium sp.]MDF1716150.1 aminoglycoside phosphotransferase family protein [Antarcticimicrobium sp.]
MSSPDAIEENVSFLLAELDGQLTRLITYFEAPRTETALQLVQRAGYAHNLSSRVRKACLAEMIRGKKAEARQLRLQGIDTIARNLDLISRLARRAVEQAERIDRQKLLRADTYVAPLKLVRKTVARIQQALEARDSKLAVQIGQTRTDLGVFNDRLFRTYTRDMQGTKHTEDLAFGLLTLNEITRMGEALQTISEAILSINIGQSVQFERYFALRSVLAGVARDEEITLQPLAETRSGSAISSVNLRGTRGETVAAVFKDGDRRKVKQERVGVKSWNSVYPGLAPEILSYEKSGKSAALLIEHLEGETFEDIVLGGTDDALAEAQNALHKTVRDIWRQTRTDDPAEMKAMEQLRKRMKDVYRLHRRHARGTQNVNGVTVPGFDALISAAAAREAQLPAPFSVYIHGDFNLDNVIYDPVGRKIRFIDLHRSRYMDYVQDISVFMVSSYRLQVLDAGTRARIAKVATDMHQMAAKFARRQKDPTFEYRLALGLARSFASSTRFVVDQSHARRMILRARYILESALCVPEGKEARFKLPIRMLFSD